MVTKKRHTPQRKQVNVIYVKHDEKAIFAAIKKTLYDNEFIAKVNNIKNPYGDGKSAIRIADIIEKIPINDSLIQKRISYDV